MARPSKLTPELQKRICTLIEKGHSHKEACKMTGIVESTFYLWMNENSEFSEAVNNAENRSREGLLDIVRNAAQKDWRASTWILERRFPEDWTKRERHEISGPDGGPIESVTLTAEEREARIAALLHKAKERAGGSDERNPS